jgi:hypothetical protein
MEANNELILARLLCTVDRGALVDCPLMFDSSFFLFQIEKVTYSVQNDVSKTEIIFNM